MKIRLSKIDDVPEIKMIIDDAKTFLASKNIDQWQNGYPNAEQVINDIKKAESYVVINNDNVIMATSMFTLKKEPTYKIIDGNWLISINEIYGVFIEWQSKKSSEN